MQLTSFTTKEWVHSGLITRFAKFFTFSLTGSSSSKSITVPVGWSLSSTTAALFSVLVRLSRSPDCFDALDDLLEDGLLLLDISPDQARRDPKSKQRQVGILVFSVKPHRIL